MKEFAVIVECAGSIALAAALDAAAHYATDHPGAIDEMLVDENHRVPVPNSAAVVELTRTA